MKSVGLGWSECSVSVWFLGCSELACLAWDVDSGCGWMWGAEASHHFVSVLL